MVFSSIPAYLDPSNWQQQPSHQNGDQSNAIPQLRQHHLPPPLAQPSLPPPPPPRPPPLQQHQQPHHVIINGDMMQSATSINSPRSMSERARIANIPIPEACLNCPRCESTNTKFCYFNNYNLTQPRHFCKTCRRYWTRGGALRSVPVGGGCRRNKRSKNTSSNNSKSSASSSSPTGSAVPSYNNRSTNNTVLDLTRHLPQQLTLLSPLGQLTDHHVSSLNYSTFPLGDTSLELNNYQMGCNLIGGVGNSVTQNGNIEQWRLNHQLQLLGAGLNSSIMGNGLYPQFQTSSFVGETSSSHDDKPSNSVFTHQLDLTEKMEENQGLTRNLMGNPTNNNSWSGATWSDYITTRFTSSCTKNPQ